MKYIIIVIYCSSIFIGCIRQPLNVYSPHPINTTVVKEDGDIGASVAYFSNKGIVQVGEGIVHSNGIALQTRAVIINNLFVESGINNLNENTNRDIMLVGTANGTRYISKTSTKYNNVEIGVGKIIKLNSNKTSNLLLSAGYGKTNFKNNFNENEGGRLASADFTFNNKHIYLNTIFQLQFGIFMYQGGFKYNFTKFENIKTNNPTYYGDEAAELARRNSNFRSFLQFYQNFGIVPSKKSSWLSLHLNLGLNARNNLAPNLKARTTSVGLSIMASPSGILKKKKLN